MKVSMKSVCCVLLVLILCSAWNIPIDAATRTYTTRTRRHKTLTLPTESQDKDQNVDNGSRDSLNLFAKGAIGTLFTGLSIVSLIPFFVPIAMAPTCPDREIIELPNIYVSTKDEFSSYFIHEAFFKSQDRSFVNMLKNISILPPLDAIIMSIVLTSLLLGKSFYTSINMAAGRLIVILGLLHNLVGTTGVLNPLVSTILFSVLILSMKGLLYLFWIATSLSGVSVLCSYTHLLQRHYDREAYKRGLYNFSAILLVSIFCINKYELQKIWILAPLVFIQTLGWKEFFLF
jgi:hypothetical protein